MRNPSLTRTLEAANAASAKKADDILILEVGPVIGITDYFLICSANNERQVRTIVEEVEKSIREKFKVKPYRREGERDLRWVLLDYLDFVVHVLHKEEREFYELERLWKEARHVDFEPEGNDPEAIVEFS